MDTNKVQCDLADYSFIKANMMTSVYSQDTEINMKHAWRSVLECYWSLTVPCEIVRYPFFAVHFLFCQTFLNLRHKEDSN